MPQQRPEKCVLVLPGEFGEADPIARGSLTVAVFT
jgi:hypothetical protein